MAYRHIDPETGFIEYTRTPEENSIIKIRQENEELKNQIEELKQLVNNKKEE